MPHFNPLPQEIATVLGPAGAEKFVDYLNSSFSLQREDVIAVSAAQFENKLIRETSEIRMEVSELRSETRTGIAEVRTEIGQLRSETRTAIAEVRTEIGELRSETRTAIAEVRTEIAELRADTKADIAGVHKEITGLHREISIQTRWMIVAAAAIITLYPVVSRLVARLIP